MVSVHGVSNNWTTNEDIGNTVFKSDKEDITLMLCSIHLPLYMWQKVEWVSTSRSKDIPRVSPGEVYSIQHTPSWPLWSFVSPSSRWLQIGEHLVLDISFIGPSLLTNCWMCVHTENTLHVVFLGIFVNTFYTTCKLQISNKNKNKYFVFKPWLNMVCDHACMNTKFIYFV